jgi:hypothetical protein
MRKARESVCYTAERSATIAGAQHYFESFGVARADAALREVVLTSIARTTFSACPPE